MTGNYPTYKFFLLKCWLRDLNSRPTVCKTAAHPSWAKPADRVVFIWQRHTQVFRKEMNTGGHYPSCGRGIWTPDLLVMSQVSFQTALSRDCYAEELNLVTRVYETQLDIRPTASSIRGLFSRYLLFLLPLHHTFHLHALGFEPRPKIYRIFY